MKPVRITLTIILLISFVLVSSGQEKYAVLITGDNHSLNVPSNDRWNGGLGMGDHGFDEFWNDTYLFWELLYTEKEYTNSNIHVLYSNGDDLTFFGQADRYNGFLTYGFNITDQSSTETNIQNLFTSTLSNITDDDFLFVWVMSHGGTDATGSYFYSYDAQKIYDTQLAGWLNGINAHKKTVFLSFPSSGGFTEEFEEKVTMVTSINYKV